MTQPEDDSGTRNTDLFCGHVAGPRAAAGSGFRHSGTISITLRVRRASRNVMKPRIQCVQRGVWQASVSASGGHLAGVRERTELHDQLSGIVLQGAWPPGVAATGPSRFRSCISWLSMIVKTYAVNMGR